MKTLLALLFAVNVHANVSPEYISTFYYDPSVTISFENWKEGNLTVKIISQNEEILYNDKLNTEAKDGIKYNLRNLESGKYRVILENDIKRVVETIILFDGKIVKKEAKVFYKPTIKMEDKKLIVNFLSQENASTISIYDESNKLYHERFVGDQALNKVLNLELLPAGKYYVIVKDESILKRFDFRI